MALLKYFKRINTKKPEKIDEILPKPDGPLSTMMPMSSIESANFAVREAMMNSSTRVSEHDETEFDDKIKRRGPYQYLTAKKSLAWVKEQPSME